MSPTRPDPIALLTGALAGTPRPEAITSEAGGGKFTPEGRVLPFPGNTVVCHVPRGTRAWAALSEMQAALRSGPLAHRFTFLPPESFHMTLFAGVSGPRGAGRPWPRDVPAGADLAAVTETLRRRLRTADLDVPPRARAVGLFGGYSVTMEGVDAAEEARFRAARCRMRDAARLETADFADYVFHVTLAYQLAWLDEAEARALVAFSDALFARLAPDLAEIPLGPPEFCTFETMYRFDPVVRLGTPRRQAHG